MKVGLDDLRGLSQPQLSFYDRGQRGRPPPSSRTRGFLAGSIVGDLLGCFSFFRFFFFFFLFPWPMFMLLGPDLPKQPRAGARKQLLLVVCSQLDGSAEQGPRALRAHSTLRGRGERVCAARWDERCAGSPASGHRYAIWDPAVSFPRQDTTESRFSLRFSQSPSFCAACSQPLRSRLFQAE